MKRGIAVAIGCLRQPRNQPSFMLGLKAFMAGCGISATDDPATGKIRSGNGQAKTLDARKERFDVCCQIKIGPSRSTGWPTFVFPVRDGGDCGADRACLRSRRQTNGGVAAGLELSICLLRQL
ncbi:hypothetical protein [Mesorhizobium hawassense]|uniref:hypothetical protein n=1 Tax=Mesorhizobium hawassense TaxID=1209954 RepID=UPI001FDF5BAC|nr:hypothetical protein [Mesorhizobium hawassense]